jgi:hypothetical protein
MTDETKCGRIESLDDIRRAITAEAERKNEDHLANVIRRMFLALQESD